MWQILGLSFLILFFIGLNYGIIKSYKDKFDRKFINIWHKFQWLIVSLQFPLVVGEFNQQVIAWYLTYYVVFETGLNLSRGKHPFYVSVEDDDGDGIPDGGGWTDRFRYKLFKEDVILFEGILKTIATIFAIIFFSRG